MEFGLSSLMSALIVLERVSSPYAGRSDSFMMETLRLVKYSTETARSHIFSNTRRPIEALGRAVPPLPAPLTSLAIER